MNYYKGQAEQLSKLVPTTPDPETIKRMKVLEEIAIGDDDDTNNTSFLDEKAGNRVKNETTIDSCFKPAKKSSH